MLIDRGIRIIRRSCISLLLKKLLLAKNLFLYQLETVDFHSNGTTIDPLDQIIFYFFFISWLLLGCISSKVCQKAFTFPSSSTNDSFGFQLAVSLGNPSHLTFHKNSFLSCRNNEFVLHMGNSCGLRRSTNLTEGKFTESGTVCL